MTLMTKHDRLVVCQDSFNALEVKGFMRVISHGLPQHVRFLHCEGFCRNAAFTPTLCIIYLAEVGCPKRSQSRSWAPDH